MAKAFLNAELNSIWQGKKKNLICNKEIKGDVRPYQKLVSSVESMYVKNWGTFSAKIMSVTDILICTMTKMQSNLLPPIRHEGLSKVAGSRAGITEQHKPVLCCSPPSHIWWAVSVFRGRWNARRISHGIIETQKQFTMNRLEWGG